MNQLKSEQIEMQKPFPSSRKVYVRGTREDIKVPFREIKLSDTETDGVTTENLPIRVYDTSGPYTDEAVVLDVHKGIERIRTPWIEERNDTEVYR